jgi:hypothetical protein
MHSERSASAIAELENHTEAVVMLILLSSEHAPGRAPSSSARSPA